MKGVMSMRYVGRSNVRCPTIGRQNPGHMPPVNTTSNGHTTPIGSPSIYTMTFLKDPCPRNEMFHFRNVSTYCSGTFEYQNSSSPFPLASTSRTSRDVFLGMDMDV